MKIAILGSAPSSLSLAPFGDTSWKIWGCSPGVYSSCSRADAWFELHRWEPPVIGVPSKQKQWFSPEYVQWMAMRDPVACPVWMREPVPEIPGSRALPVDNLVAKFGSYFFTSSIAWMMACAIDEILEERDKHPDAIHHDTIGLWGVDMAANEEYGYQRAGCQHFALLAADLGINIWVPAESDLLRPMPLYGVSESSHWMIKNTVRREELQRRLAGMTANLEAAIRGKAFIEGALDDLNYQMQTWGEDREGIGTDPLILGRSKKIQDAVKLAMRTDPPPPPAVDIPIKPEAAKKPTPKAKPKAKKRKR